MLALTFALIAASPATAAPATRPDADAAEIVQLERQWGEAFVKHDFAFIERIVAPEFRLFVAQPDGRYTLAPRAVWMRNGQGWRYTHFVA